MLEKIFLRFLRSSPIDPLRAAPCAAPRAHIPEPKNGTGARVARAVPTMAVHASRVPTMAVCKSRAIQCAPCKSRATTVVCKVRANRGDMQGPCHPPGPLRGKHRGRSSGNGNPPPARGQSRASAQDARGTPGGATPAMAANGTYRECLFRTETIFQNTIPT